MSITSCHISGFILIMRVSRVMPALFTSTSTVPHLSTTVLNRASISARCNENENSSIIYIVEKCVFKNDDFLLFFVWEK